MGQKAADGTKPSFWGTTTGIFTAVGGFLGAVAGLLGILVSVGVIGGSGTPPNVLPPTGEAVDCSQATHPAFETDVRVFIIDGLRRHYSFDGEYTVEEIAKVRDWAYVEGAPYPAGTDRAYLLEFDGLLWNWRWEGDIGARPRQSGLPPLPRSLLNSLLLCES